MGHLYYNMLKKLFHHFHFHLFLKKNFLVFLHILDGNDNRIFHILSLDHIHILSIYCIVLIIFSLEYFLHLLFFLLIQNLLNLILEAIRHNLNGPRRFHWLFSLKDIFHFVILFFINYFLINFYLNYCYC